jgi:hypothetical protein
MEKCKAAVKSRPETSAMALLALAPQLDFSDPCSIFLQGITPRQAMLESSTEESGSSIRVAAVIMLLLICILSGHPNISHHLAAKTCAESFVALEFVVSIITMTAIGPLNFSERNKFGLKSALFDP